MQSMGAQVGRFLQGLTTMQGSMVAMQEQLALLQGKMDRVLAHEQATTAAAGQATTAAAEQATTAAAGQSADQAAAAASSSCDVASCDVAPQPRPAVPPTNQLHQPHLFNPRAPRKPGWGPLMPDAARPPTRPTTTICADFYLACMRDRNGEVGVSANFKSRQDKNRFEMAVIWFDAISTSEEKARLQGKRHRDAMSGADVPPNVLVAQLNNHLKAYLKHSFEALGADVPNVLKGKTTKALTVNSLEDVIGKYVTCAQGDAKDVKQQLLSGCKTFRMNAPAP